jgi:hypothetical protein
VAEETIEVTLIDANRHGREPSPAVMRETALPAAKAAEEALESGQDEAESEARNALRDVVDAFLGDRDGNHDLFHRAHRLGAAIAGTAGCWWSEEGDRYAIRCPVFALHRMFAHSVALTTLQKCSICGSEPLSCDHIPGVNYNGKVCGFEVTKILPVGHIAITANPEFAYTWHRPETIKTDKLIADGILRTAGEAAACTHCLNCSGLPSKEDLDPISRLQRLAAENQQPTEGPS